jgi:hypothetical protein
MAGLRRYLRSPDRGGALKQSALNCREKPREMLQKFSRCEMVLLSNGRDCHPDAN